MVKGLVVLLADVAVPRRDRLTEVGVVLHLALLEADRRKDVGRRELGLPAQLANAGHREDVLFALHAGRLALSFDGLQELPASQHVRPGHLPGRREQACAIGLDDPNQQRPVGGDGFEQFGRGPHTVGQAHGRGRIGHRADGVS